MFKKRRIKKDYDTALAEGNAAKAEQLARENPWLQDYVSDDIGGPDLNLKQACAAIGIMEDELNTAVPLDEILYSMEMDFNVQISASELETIVMDLETKHYIKSELGGYTLTIEGGKICDNYLNHVSRELIDDLPSNA
ncbi:MAG: hypothetical protein ACTSUE_06105 [Promethearchaeota archaeon]